MKLFEWNTEKNDLLKKDRGVSFSDVVDAIQGGNLIDDIVTTNASKYPNQRMFVVLVGDYVYVVPYVEDERKIFLKTVFRSRKAYRKYGGTHARKKETR